ncbi:PhoH family protein, partial [Klebsiella pneumoniae]|uniref:PhoH family protein n=1 Tax=Klebsiella pneumoniae TaxID=573 RepID=UPI0027317992
MRKKTYKEKVREASDNRQVQPLVPKNPAQKNYMECIYRFPQVFVTGPAGTGKTYIAASIAAD